ncbi:amino acid permease [Proteiniphilum sp.]|uniref:amino acid permease n=1 Tax=Proteiniphilum sp. TaxID=1926877 RepID=UPI002B212E55|nr:amino acid permease [Proteiniphilum sp.]MEA4919055.1 amino acid permease [Proteiniphilum sp.]
MAANLFVKKNITQLQHEAESSNNQLRRHLTAPNLVMLGVGAVIGAGIFVLTGTAAAIHAGPGISVSFILSAFGCLLAGLCYAEFASMIPISGSAYTYGYATMGEFVAWIIGWDLVLEYLFGASTVAVGWSGYVVSFLADFGIHLPAVICQGPFAYGPDGWYVTGTIINFPAVFIVAITTTLLVVGIKESAKFNNIIVLIKVIVILLFIGFGISYINTENWQPFIPENNGTWGEYGWSGILAGAAVVFFAYVGFDAVSTTSQEAINPKRDMPIGILGTLLICTILYIAVGLVLTGIVNYKELNVAAPIAVAIDNAGQGLFWLRPIIKIGAIAGLSSVVLVLLLGQSRVFYTMAKDGLLWENLSKTHPKFRTPHITTIIIGIAAGILAGLFPIDMLGHMVSIGTLLAFIIVSIGIIILRKKEPDMPRAFKTPWVPFVPILGALCCLALMASLPLDAWIRLIGWMAIGMIVYFLYGRRHSHARKMLKK